MQAQFLFTTNNDGIIITGYTGLGGEVIIPAKINKREVTGIGPNAFELSHSLTSITIPDSVTNIGKDAFEYLDSLTNVTIGKRVAHIGDRSISGCNSLSAIHVDARNAMYCSVDGILFSKDRSVLARFPSGIAGSYTIPSHVTRVGASAFIGCYGLDNVTIPDSVTNIGHSAFSGCTFLTNIVIGHGVTQIGNYAFYNCIRLTSATLGNSVANIGDWAFEGCYRMTSINIPRSVTRVGPNAFDSCNGLTCVLIPDGIVSIEEQGFYQCGFTNVTIPASVRYIGERAFSCCHDLESVIISDGVTNIPGSAFSGCTSLASVTIPGSVSSIGGLAFYDCPKLASVRLLNEDTYVDKTAFIKCPSLREVPTNSATANINESIRRKSKTRYDKFAGLKPTVFEDITNVVNITRDPIKGMAAAKVLADYEYDGKDAYDGFLQMLSSSELIAKMLAQKEFHPDQSFDRQFNRWCLENEVKSDNDRIRSTAVEGLGNIGDPRAIDTLIQVIHKDTDPLVYGNVVMALGKIAINIENASNKALTERIRQILLTAFHETDRNQAKRDIYKALSLIGNPDDVVLFRQALNWDITFKTVPEQTHKTQLGQNIQGIVNLLGMAEMADDQKLIAGLGKIGGDNAVQELLCILKNEKQNKYYRAKAANTIGVALLAGRYPVTAKVKAAALSGLTNASTDPDQVVSSSAVKALNEMR